MSVRSSHTLKNVPLDQFTSLRCSLEQGKEAAAWSILNRIEVHEDSPGGIHIASFLGVGALEEGDRAVARRAFRLAYERAQQSDSPYLTRLDLLCNAATLFNVGDVVPTVQERRNLRDSLHHDASVVKRDSAVTFTPDLLMRFLVAAGEVGSTSDLSLLAEDCVGTMLEARRLAPVVAELMFGNECVSRILLRGSKEFDDAEQSYESAANQLRHLPGYHSLIPYTSVMRARLAEARKDVSGVRYHSREASRSLLAIPVGHRLPCVVAITLHELAKHGTGDPVLQSVYKDVFQKGDFPLRYLSSALVQWCASRVLGQELARVRDDDAGMEVINRFRPIAERAAFLTHGLELSAREMAGLHVTQSKIAEYDGEYLRQVDALRKAFSVALRDPSALEIVWGSLIQVTWDAPEAAVSPQLLQLFVDFLRGGDTSLPLEPSIVDFYGHLLVGVVTVVRQLDVPNVRRVGVLKSSLDRFLKKLGDAQSDMWVTAEVVADAADIIEQSWNLPASNRVAEALRTLYLRVEPYSNPRGSDTEKTEYFDKRLKLEEGAVKLFTLLEDWKIVEKVNQKIDVIRNDMGHTDSKDPDDDGLGGYTEWYDS